MRSGDGPDAIEGLSALLEQGGDRLRLLDPPHRDERLGRVAVNSMPPEAGSGSPVEAAIVAGGPSVATAAS